MGMEWNEMELEWKDRKEWNGMDGRMNGPEGMESSDHIHSGLI